MMKKMWHVGCNMNSIKIVSWIVYIILIGLFIWGGRLAKTRTFHKDFMSLDATKSLRGFAAIGVILHHISQEQAFQNAHELGIFLNAGYYCVSIFFFCSGYGLIKNLNQKSDYMKGFLKKRLPVILIPYYVSALVYFIYRFFICKEKMPIMQIITGLLGLTMMNEYAWYPVILFILYLAFYLLFRKDDCKSDRNGRFFIMFLVIVFLGAVFCVNGHFAWWAKDGAWWFNGESVNENWWMKEKVLLMSGEWWVNSAIAFLVGLIVADKEEKIVPFLQKKYGVKVVIALLLAIASHMLSVWAQGKFQYWSEWNYENQGPHILDKFICFVAQFPEIGFFVIFIFMIMMKFRTINPVTRFFGKVSLETYLMNLIAIRVFGFILYNPRNKMVIIKPHHYNFGIYIVCVCAGTVILGLIFKIICNQLQKLIK